MVRLTEKLVLEKTKCTSLYGVRNINLWGSSLDDVDELVKEIERGERAVPVLVRQYLKLGGVFLGFNVDPDFSDVVDGLVLVDLLRMNRRLLRFYFSEDGAKRFVERHPEADAQLRAAGAI